MGAIFENEDFRKKPSEKRSTITATTKYFRSAIELAITV